MDVRFYTLDFLDLRILPPHSNDIGYVSMNTETEFRGNGSFEMTFRDEDVEVFVKAHPEGLLVKWGDFDGFLTDYQFNEKKRWLFGSHLNAVLHKFVVPPQTIDGDLKTAVKTLIEDYTPIAFEDDGETFGDITYTSEDKYYHLDALLLELATQARVGYKVYIKEQQLWFKLLKEEVNPLILSKNNRNVYETQEDFSNKTVAYGGWYKNTVDANGAELETPVWTYFSLAEKAGLYRQDVILNATTAKDAEKELRGYSATRDTACKTRNVAYGTDYKLGDILRYQTKSGMEVKQVSKISLWHEKSTYHEEPTLTEWEEDAIDKS